MRRIEFTIYEVHRCKHMCFSHEPIINPVKPSTIIHTEAHTDNAITQNRKLCELETIQVDEFRYV